MLEGSKPPAESTDSDDAATDSRNAAEMAHLTDLVEKLSHGQSADSLGGAVAGKLESLLADKMASGREEAAKLLKVRENWFCLSTSYQDEPPSCLLNANTA